jgi:hypothetical protein
LISGSILKFQVKIMKKILVFLALSLFVCVSIVAAQPRIVEKKPEKQPVVLAAVSFKAKYEGGMFGFEDKREGTLKFDDVNERLVFFSKDQKEQFAIPYDAMVLVYTGTRSVRSGTATAVSVIPLPGAGLAGLFREKRRYLTIQFSDPNIEARGIVNFKLDNDKTRDSVIHTLGKKAKLTQRGDAYYRQREAPKTEL